MGRDKVGTPEQRRDWYERFQKGELVTHIAKSVGHDRRTVKDSIALEAQEQEKREARLIVLKRALERHNADLCNFAGNLRKSLRQSEEIVALESKPMYKALKEHMPRSPIWRQLEKLKNVRQEVSRLQQEFDAQMVDAVPKRLKLPLRNELDQPGLQDKGILVAFSEEFASAMRGSPGRLVDGPFKTDRRDDDTCLLFLGAYTVGRIPNALLDHVQTEVLVMLREASAKGLEEDVLGLHRALTAVTKELEEELEVIVLKRVVEGRCRYCPL